MNTEKLSRFKKILIERGRERETEGDSVWKRKERRNKTKFYVFVLLCPNQKAVEKNIAED